MRRARALFAVLIAAATGAVAFVLHGQSLADPNLVVLQGVGLPAVEQGAIYDESRSPASAETARRTDILRTLQEARAGSPAAYVPGRVIVRFKDGASSDDRLNAVRSISANAAIAERPSYANFDLVRLDRTADAEAAAAALRQRGEVEYAQPAYRVHTMMVPNDPYYLPSATFSPGQWNLRLIDLERAWDIQPAAGSKITVAVLDTGMAYTTATVTANVSGFTDDAGQTYPALGHIVLPYAAATQLVGAGHAGRIVKPHDFIWDTDMPLDFDGHGTHVSGTIGQLTNDSLLTAGVAFNVNLMPVKVIDSMWDDLFGSPNQGDDATVARGIRYAADNGANVINMSIGRTGPPDTAPVIEDAIRYAVGKGVFIAIAGGNEFENGNPKEVLAEIASRVQGAVSVAAVDRDAYSQTGDRRCTGAPGLPDCHAYYSSTGTWIELAAPGGSERGFGRDGFVWQQTFNFNFTDTFLLPPSQYGPPRFDVLAVVGYIGTSMATPHVAGVAAMLMQQGITSPAAVEDALEKFAVDLGDPGRDNVFGFGLVDARNALRGLGLAR